MFNLILTFFEIGDTQRREQSKNSRNETYVLDFIIDFFNLKKGKREDKFKMKKQGRYFNTSEDSGKSFLLVLDNC